MNDRYVYKDKEFFPIKYPVDASYINVIGMQIIAGRNFSREISSDSTQSVIINEALARTELGLTPEKAIGKILGNGWEGPGKPQVIIGVVRDFNFEPLTRNVRSQLFTMPGDLDPVDFFVRIKAGDPSSAIKALQGAWKTSSVDLPFKYSFLDEDLDRFYKSEEKWSSIVGWAGTISIFLACLGLFGLAALAAVNRTKEIGIRKVLGASIQTIIRLLSKDFLRLVIIALVIASPLAWYFMHKWLQNYAYRINIGWFTFAITGVIALLIAFITISFQAIKAATANPVSSLRSE
jgi:putative ABC transport system permease protein